MSERIDLKRVEKRQRLLRVTTKKKNAESQRDSAAVQVVEESEGSEEEERNKLKEKARRLREEALGKFGNRAVDDGHELDTAAMEEETADMVRDQLWADLMGEAAPSDCEEEEALFLRRFRRPGGANIDVISTLYRHMIDIISIFDCISKQYRLRIDTCVDIASI